MRKSRSQSVVAVPVDSSIARLSKTTRQTIEEGLTRLQLDVSKDWWKKGKAYHDLDAGRYCVEIFQSPVHPMKLITGKSIDELAVNIWQWKQGYKFGRVILP